jgi:hypothetical protein
VLGLFEYDHELSENQYNPTSRHMDGLVLSYLEEKELPRSFDHQIKGNILGLQLL